MDDSISLRWILIAVGLLILAVIFISGRSREPRAGKSGSQESFEAHDDNTDELHRLGGSISIGSDDNADISIGSSADDAGAVNIGAEGLVSLMLVADEGELFSGNRILHAVTQEGLEYGDHKIFHFHKPGNHAITIFSIASLVEPGYFEMEGLNDFSTPGILFFMQIPQPGGNVPAFDLMLEKAEKIRLMLNGSLKDSSNSSLTQQTISHIREQLLRT